MEGNDHNNNHDNNRRLIGASDEEAADATVTNTTCTARNNSQRGAVGSNGCAPPEEPQTDATSSTDLITCTAGDESSRNNNNNNLEEATNTTTELPHYERVLKDLRERGLDELATEIVVRLTSTGLNTINDKDKDEDNEDNDLNNGSTGMGGSMTGSSRGSSSGSSRPQDDGILCQEEEEEEDEDKLKDYNNNNPEKHIDEYERATIIKCKAEQDLLLKGSLQNYDREKAAAAVNTTTLTCTTTSIKVQYYPQDPKDIPDDMDLEKPVEEIRCDLEQQQPLGTFTDMEFVHSNEPERRIARDDAVSRRQHYQEAGSATTDMTFSSSDALEHAASKSSQDPVPPPTRLVRNEPTSACQMPNSSSTPGAYFVTPSSGSLSLENISTLESSLSFRQQLRRTGSSDDNTAASMIDVGLLVEEGRSRASSLRSIEEQNRNPAGANTPSVIPDDAENPDPSLALEAVRVDDIMTVKAEPLDETQSKRILLFKAFACIMCALVVIVVVITVSLTYSKNGGTSNDNSTPVPTYSPESRFELIQQLLLERFGPIYDFNYNTTNGTQILQKAFADPASPQYQALEWIALQDRDVEAIAEPFLEVDETLTNPDNQYDYPVITAANSDGTQTLILATNPDQSDRRKRQLRQQQQRRRLVSYDRIVQRYALAVLYFATGNWTDSFEFLSEGHECDWAGALQCIDPTTGGAVTHLYLRSNQLAGQLPLELAALTFLQSIVFSGNALTGTLPPALYTLSDLTLVDLGFNKFNGTIPDVYYENWIKLESWSLAECDLSGTISSNIGHLSNLKALAWPRNALHGPIPREFWTNLTNMEELDLSQQSEKFENDTIGTEIGLWSNLKSFAYHGLELRGGIPTELGQLTHLEQLQVASNHLSGTIPSELGLLTALTRLSLSLNAITGTVPKELIYLTSLERLYLQNTLLTGNVSFICEAIDAGILPPMDPMRVDMMEVSGCYCCTCCLY